jgi:hypothetical protein
MLRKFIRRPAIERRLLLEALVIVPAVRFFLSVLPFRVVQRIVRSASALRQNPTASVKSIVWSVKAVSARVPHASCLTQALAGTILLARHGYDATLRLGVQRKDDGGFAAHAWLECDGAPILGEPEPGVFHVLPPVAPA